MKQFITCLLLSVFFHFLASILGGSFNPMEWKQDTESAKLGTLMYLFFEMVIWIAPMMLNYLNGEENFKN